MKYNDKNKPLICMMTQSTCYKGTHKMKPLGVLWHSTGANNPTIKRYVQPDDNVKDRQTLLNKIGINQYGNDWNHIYHEAGLNAWIGKLADGTVSTVQTMPWDFAPWGCGSGVNGSCNERWVQFEICEDGMTDKTYFESVYKEACELTAYLCKMYGINPNGTVTYNGVTVPTILCHQDSYRLGLGCNHSDVYPWFNKFGKTMQNVRDDVQKLLTPPAPGKAPDGSKGEIAGTDKPRFTDELVLYYNGSRALTNQYGFECACDKHGVILENPAYKGGTAIPQGGKVISGHGKAGEWMKKNLKAGYLVWVENGVLKVSKKQHRSVDGVNEGRGSNMLIVYDKGVVNTNPYGYEVQIKDGKAVSAPVYGKGKMQLPKGGFVLSGHLLNKTDSAGWWIYKNIKKGTKVTFDGRVVTIS